MSKKIIIVGRNVSAYGKKNMIENEWNWNYTIKCAKYHNEKGSLVFVVVPHWVDKEIIDELRKYSTVQLVNVKRGKKWDHEVALAIAIQQNGYLVTNSSNIYLPDNGCTLFLSHWLEGRKIRFEFNENGCYVPIKSRFNEKNRRLSEHPTRRAFDFLSNWDAQFGHNLNINSIDIDCEVKEFDDEFNEEWE